MAVYTKVSQTDIISHLKNYQIGNLISLKEIIAGIDNSNFLLETDLNGYSKFIFTIFESRINKNDLPFFINFKLHLAKNGILCPQPILDNEGSSIVDINGKKSAIVTFLNGANLKPQDDGYYKNITSKHCFEVAKNLAKLHLAAKDFNQKRINDLSLDNWPILLAKISDKLDEYQKNLHSEISNILDYLKQHWRFDLPSAACHLDLFPDNVFFDENSQFSGVIDFYFAATDLLIYDFAIIVNAWCFDEKNNFIDDRFSAMLEGYNSVRKFSDDEKEFLKIALTGAAIRFLLTRLHDMFFTPKTALIKIKNPQEYLAKLRFFAQKL